MRILLIHQYFLEKQEGGGSRFNEMAKIWASNGHQITVIAGMIHANAQKKYPQYKGKYFHLEDYETNIKVLRCHVSERYNANFTGRLWAYFSFVVSSIAGFFLKLNGNYDLVLVTSPPLFVGITGLIISKIKQIPLVFEIRDLWPESAIDTGILSNKFLIKLAFWFESFMYRNAQLINVLTPAFRNILIEKKHISPAKIILIPNGSDFSMSDKVVLEMNREAIRERLGWQGKFVVVYVGAHGLANDLGQILDAAILLKGTNALFALIGDGMQKQTLKDKALEMSLNNVIFLDPVAKEKVFEYTLAADCGLSVMQKNETFKTIYSNKTFDYMGSRIPILMAIDGISKSLVENSKAGLFVEPANKFDFEAKIKWLMEHTQEAKQMGENGYSYAKANFDRKILATQYLDYLLSLIQR